jgi:ABC-2 type transport system ATP-binding protein
MLKITDLCKSYKKFQVLRGLNMNLSKGDVYGFLGRNGCGKTTTMNIICNIVSKDSGNVEFVGRDDLGAPSSDRGAGVSSPDRGTDIPGGKPKIGYLTESPALYGFMNGYEYLRYIASCADYRGNVNQRIDEVLQLTGMKSGATRRIKGYSRGMNQRLGIAAAIFAHPELLILDEPTSALDPEGRAEVMGIIDSLRQSGVTIILCTHIITDVERVANKIGIMKDGVIAEEGTIDEVVAKYRSQSSQITVRLANPEVEVASKMAMLPSVDSNHYNQTNGEMTLGSVKIDLLYYEIIEFLNEHKIKVSELVAQKTTLEDVYFAVTGLRGGGA